MAIPVFVFFLFLIISVVLILLWNRSGRIPVPPRKGINEWHNWSCNQSANPKAILTPKTVEELKQILRENEEGIRIVGAGHSFSRLVCTTEVIISLDYISGNDPVISVDQERKTAWVKAGARLKDLSPALAEHNLAFRNLGDINVQSLAGATATGTHGTGQSFPCLSAEIRGVKVLCANGEVVTATIEDNPDFVRAVQVSLGAFGVLLEVEVNLTEKYFLHRNAWMEPLEKVLSFAHEKWKDHRNFEFFYIPHSGYCACITHDEVAIQTPVTVENQDTEVLMSLKQLRDFLGWAPSIRRKLLQAVMQRVKPEEEIEESWKLLANERDVRFTEMEYHLPVKNALAALEKVIDFMENRRSEVFFPIEVRKTKGDEAWLSPFQGEPRISIAVHAFFKEDYGYFFSDIERIFLENGGRPHWGKLHSLTSTELRNLYPDFDRFCDIRREVDPSGKFLTPYLRKILDV